MPKSSSPPALSSASSPSPSDHQRPRYLRASHTQTLPAEANRNRPQKSEAESSRDSANFRAAQMLLQKRLDAGLSQEQLASLAGESPRQIGRRERGEVHLGALRLLVVLDRAAKVKVVK